MKEKIGRNDPCPCGSGRKYKKCCLNKDKHSPFLPNESFKTAVKKKPTPINHHLESNDGGRSWRQAPGCLAVRLACKPVESSNIEIDDIFKSLDKTKLSDTGLNACIHKLYAVKYHLDNFVSREILQVQKLKENCSPPAGAQIEEIDSVFIYELESFLFQVKSSLDVLTIGVINKSLGFSLGTYAPQQIIDASEKNKKTIGEQKASKIEKIVSENRDWIEEVNEMRIQITHLSDLKNFCCFIVLPFAGGDEVTICYPSMPDGTRATKYIESIWQKLLYFYKSFLDALAG